jgi:4-amino-4-deoxy-L-arabinose transferase-like glycosyltransferase
MHADKANGVALMKTTVIHLLLISAVAGAVLFTNLGTARLWDRDEPRNAGCAAEMMERGDFVVPIFNNELRHQKPVLLYWLMMSAYAVFGVNEFSARFWSAVLAMGTVWMTYGIGRRLFHPNVGMIAAIALATSLMFGVAGRAATPDSVLIFCSTLAIFIYVMGTFAAKTNTNDPPKLRTEKSYFPKSWWVVAAMYGVMGFGVLAKGLAGAVLPTAIIGMFLLIQRLPRMDEQVRKAHSRIAQILISIARTFNPWHFLKTCWSMRPLTAIGMILLVAAPWYVMVGLQTEGDFLNEFLIGEHFGRATVAQESHGGSLFYYPLAILIGFFPWSVFLGPMVIGLDKQLVKKDNWSPAVVLMICWVCVQVGIFSVAKTKLPSYVTPCYPALAMLIGVVVYRIAIGKAMVGAFWIKGSFASLAIAGMAIAAGLFYAGQEYLAGDWRVAVFGAIPLIGGAIGLVLFWKQQVQPALIAAAISAVLFAIGFFGFGTVLVDSHQQSHVVLERVNETPAGTPLATYRCLESSWVVYANRPITELIPVDKSVGKVAAGRDKFWDDIPDLPVQQYFAENPRGLLITRSEHLAEIEGLLPADYEVWTESPFFLKRDNLILIGPKKGSARDIVQTAGQPVWDAGRKIR